MATNTLLQRLDTAANTTGSSTAASNRVQFEDFIADGAVADGAVVMFDLAETNDADKMLKVVEAAAAKAGIGVNVNGAAASAGDRVKACIAGICEALVEGVNSSGTNAAINVGDYLCMSDNPGVLGLFRVANDGQPLAIAAQAVASGAATAKVTVVVLKQF